MKVKQFICWAIFLGGCFHLAVNSVCAQNWLQTSAPSNAWVSVATSADGSKIAAAAGTYLGDGLIYISTNSGATWKSTGAKHDWHGVSTSADGKKLMAYDANGSIYVSANSGGTWVSYSTNQIHSLATSADGVKLVAGSLNFVKKSVNTASDWATSSIPSLTWRNVASSADGTKLVAQASSWPLTGFIPVFTSTDSGMTWVSNSISTTWIPYDNSYAGLVMVRSLASSADGNRLIMATTNGPLLISINAGLTWNPANVVGTHWESVASSASGQTLVAANINYFDTNITSLFVSRDFGQNWTLSSSLTNRWAATACSADGNKIVAVQLGGLIYTLQTTYQPRVSIQPNGTNLVLSWIVPTTNFAVQYSSDLSDAGWQTLTNALFLNLTNLQNQVTVPLSSDQFFYRLKAP